MITKQIESNKKIKQIERKQKTENRVQDIDLGRFFELASSDIIYVNNLNLHRIKNAILQDYTGDFELNGSLLVGEIEQKQTLGLKMPMISKPI